MKINILDYLHELISQNVSNDNAYQTRYKGFVGELELKKWFEVNRSDTKSFSGGYFISQSRKSALKKPVYFTVCCDSSDEYLDIYKALSNIPCRAMYFIYWNKGINLTDWEQKDIMGTKTLLPVPSMTFLKYDIHNHCFLDSSELVFKSEFQSVERTDISYGISDKEKYKQRMNLFDEKDLIELYVQRLVFDGFLGFGIKKGLPSDIDFIINSNVWNRIQFLEVKEKDLSKREPKGFGMDAHRIDDIRLIQSKTGIDYYYIVRRVNNQKERVLKEWLVIGIDDFIKNLTDYTIQGGHGMRAEGTDNPTYICPYRFFKKLK